MKRLFALLLLVSLVACGGPGPLQTYDEQAMKQADSIVYLDRSVDSLTVVLDRFEKAGNKYGVVVACRELGRSYRNASMFSEAIDIHKKGLAVACEIADTIQIIQAYNNIGTDYRRMSVLDEASDFHYQALAVSAAYSDQTSKTALKNRVVSLNGIGNVQLSLGNPEEAERVFRDALKGETALGSYLGQAINYANIGAILEERGQIDSARAYYAQSLTCNELAKSDLGISLCHTHFGRLYENEGNLDKAIFEYRLAYDAMKDNKDRWHWLESCLCLSRVYAAKGNSTLAKVYLSEAKTAAQQIYSIGHLADVYRQEYKIESAAGNYKKALDAYKKSSEYSNQAANEKNLTHMQNVRVRYERERKQAEISLLQQNYAAEKHGRNIILVTIIVALAFAVIAIVFLIFNIYLSSKNQKMLKEVERTRMNFFTNITHEFRTPLTVIISAAQDIHSKNKADKTLQRDSVDIIRHGKGLLDLVNQILDIAKISSRNASAPSWRRGDVIGFITMICESHLKYAERKDLRIVYGFDLQRLEMDFIPSYLIRIVQNLLSNAIKFSYPRSDILVSAKVVDIKGGSAMQLYVCDTGVGMTQEQKEVIFKPFYQAHDDTANIGSGVGLSLVKLTAEAMGGTVEVHSYPSEGSVFIVTIPITNTHHQSERIHMEDYSFDLVDMINNYIPEDQENLNADAPRILIVEDTPDVARWQMRQLNPEYSFYFAADGQEGLKKAQEIVPDLIITDVMMPVMDGYELCRRVRESELLRHIPVIMVTAKAHVEDRIKGLEAGADAYVEKPFHPDELSVRVSKLLQQRAILRNVYGDVTDRHDQVEKHEMSAPDKAFVEKLSQVIHDHIVRGKIDYEELAADFFVGKTQLNRKIKAITGYTTTEYILQIRVSMAKQLLVKTDYTIGEIASRVGIDDVAYFSAVFRKATGKTPTAFRNR